MEYTLTRVFHGGKDPFKSGACIRVSYLTVSLPLPPKKVKWCGEQATCQQ